LVPRVLYKINEENNKEIELDEEGRIPDLIDL
jgi:hypothetical protein